MALRRLFSGWLIAVAALARSLAQALERASEDRSASAQDPVMAALAERYPGAPAHWLAHVAQRTSQLAETGAAPFSLDSDPAAWPTPLPDGPAPRPLAAETAPPPRRVEPAPRRDAEVPSLAALRDRPSEVWRRSDPEPRRRPRPVFAAASERPTPPAPAAHRPRSPLSVAGAPSQTVAASPEPAPTPEAATGKGAGEATWSAPPSPRLAGPEIARARMDAQVAERSVGPAFASAASTSPAARSDAPTEVEADTASTAAVRQRAWFFAKPGSGHGRRSLDLAPLPSRSAQGGETNIEEAGAEASPPRPGFPYATADRRADGRDRPWRALTPATARRTIFRALAALRARPRPRPDRLEASEPRIGATRHAVQLSPDGAPSPPASSLRLSRVTSSSHAAPAFPPFEGEAPPRGVEMRKPSRAPDRAERRPSSASFPADGRRDAGKRPAFTAPRSDPSRTAPSFADTPPDGRWPALPPSSVTAPPGVEAAPPRWDQLAREQEEGRWSV